ncbi:MAG: PAS domain-containing protein [Verrucomicrobiae bacterium]|nr:PAS domain-containing protein [Verrucomicrobiae bacterium]
MKAEILFGERSSWGLMSEPRRVEQALGESELRYVRLLAAITDYIYTVTVEGGCAVATAHGPACAAVTGYTSAEFASDPYLWYRVIHEEDREAVVAQAGHILAGQVPPPLDHRLIHKQGGVRWVRNTTIPHHDASGRLVAYDGLISDITSRKSAELLLAVEYAVTRELIEADRLAEAVPRVLEHLCRTLLWSHAAYWERGNRQWRGGMTFWRPPLRAADYEITGGCRLLDDGAGLPGWVCSKGEAVWVPDIRVVPELTSAAPPEAAGFRAGCAFPVHVNRHLAGVIELYSRDVREPDERMLEVLTTIGVHLGQFLEKKQSEERMKETDRRLRHSQAIAHVGSWELDIASRGLAWSDEAYRIFGLEQGGADLSYEDFLACVHPDDRACVDTAYSESVRDGRDTFELEHRIVRPGSGEERIVHEKCEHVRDAGGEIVRSVGMVQDITDRKLAACELETAFGRIARRDLILKSMIRRLKASHRNLKETQMQLIQAAKLESVGTLAAGVAHEVKNPLQTILLGLHFLTRRFADQPEEVIHTLSDMRESVLRANAIIRELLSLSAGTEFHSQPADVTAVLERSLRLMRNDLMAGKIELVCEFGPDLPPVPMDAAKMEQVFINFVLNATQAMPQGGRLRVVTRELRLEDDPPARQPLLRRFKTGQRLVMVVLEDTGSGIAEADLPRIFDPFFTTKPVGVGTGLGLTVARKIVDLHEGAVEIGNAPTGGVRVAVVLKA